MIYGAALWPLWALLQQPAFSTWIHTIQPDKTQCFHEHLVPLANPNPPLTSTTFSFQLLGGNSDTITAWVQNPSQVAIESVADIQFHEFKVDPKEEGIYSLCFKEADGKAKSVQFSIFGEAVKRDASQDREPDADGQEEDSKVQPMLKAVSELEWAVLAIKEEQQYLIVRERRHRATASSTVDRIFWWGMVQTGALISICLFQVAWLRRSFEVRRVV